MMKRILNLLLCVLAFGACNPEQSRQLSDTSKASYDSLQIPLDHDTLGREFAKQQLHELLKEKVQPFTWDTLIRNSATAIAMVEPLLFDIFGKEQYLRSGPMKFT